MEGGLEDRLEAAEDEVATRGGVDHEAEMVGQQVLRQPVALDASEGREPADGSVGIGVEQRQHTAAERLILLLRWPGDVEVLEDREPRRSCICSPGEGMAGRR